MHLGKAKALFLHQTVQPGSEVCIQTEFVERRVCISVQDRGLSGSLSVHFLTQNLERQGSDRLSGEEVGCTKMFVPPGLQRDVIAAGGHPEYFAFCVQGFPWWKARSRKGHLRGLLGPLGTQVWALKPRWSGGHSTSLLCLFHRSP